MVKESRLRNSWSEVGSADFPFSEPPIFPELPPFWFLFGGKSLILICRRLPFLSCRNTDCCLIIASNGAENYAFRNRTLRCQRGYERFSSSGTKIIGRSLAGRAFLNAKTGFVSFFSTN